MARQRYGLGRAWHALWLALCCAVLPPAQACDGARNIRLREPVRLSAGLALLGPDDTSLEALRARADTALYQAKAEGRDRLVLAASTATPPASPALAA